MVSSNPWIAMVQHSIEHKSVVRDRAQAACLLVVLINMLCYKFTNVYKSADGFYWANAM